MLDPGLTAMNSSDPDSDQHSTPSYNSPTSFNANPHPLPSPMTSNTNMMDQTKGQFDYVQNVLAPGDASSEIITTQGENRVQNFSSSFMLPL